MDSIDLALNVVVTIPIVNGVRQSNILMIIKVVFRITIMCNSYTYCKRYTIIDWDGVNWGVPSSPTLITI